MIREAGDGAVHDSLLAATAAYGHGNTRLLSGVVGAAASHPCVHANALCWLLHGLSLLMRVVAPPWSCGCCSGRDKVPVPPVLQALASLLTLLVTARFQPPTPLAFGSRCVERLMRLSHSKAGLKLQHFAEAVSLPAMWCTLNLQCCKRLHLG